MLLIALLLAACQPSSDIKETADTLGLTESNVKIRLLRARLSLREQLSVYYGERMLQEKTND